ncbi:ubiquitin carboxyl-terminal hydrolase MINDY-1-like isoform X1 [Biomphalaria glabrata]|uniref:Ubiquitin carboxyl-terminal hydrolase n=1 Tax=Biomphalaria glabrata TaxID=6526 RepID=A0A9W3BHQ9_BIOGL|nr:ubiquitin carboxyl-terminal hydrolase MINDY-1-like isoform X1 [Biomphalaria glabrata]XP_013090957.2 ubiquitin carboxyl-terminal hydrolase MINDY-1-like isoform X1 [Biomphalaria glabrata]XP_013090958.2 ubiquitin carboxyl-terminal hydrolase MINDY-1-like isoform X1 [Biomphalaria glabrata]XP_013090959.2 ubiquitin carboxyl-terminal hydrolase MINDY-1-like isoform X1 [Biomphalaria glabrata]XP_055898966.1 ubiquitin carboxyl-terminal hydrolase MINDY-1-like isoform X1 [Biomphalaria glabrata]XP_0558989
MDDQGANKDDALESTPPPVISETASSDDHLTVQRENEAASNIDSVAASNEMELSPAASNLKHSNVIDNKLTSPEYDQQGEHADGTPQSETSSSSEKNVPSNHLPEQFSPSLDQLGTSLTSSPKSSSSGQDSGLSPDDSGFDISKTQSCDEPSKEPQTTKAQKEQDTQSEKVNISGGSLNSASPDTTTSASETQVTVSDLESPSAENVAAEPCSALTKSDQESVYYIKWITFGQNNVPIITQNENGPCPLLAIMNVLLLKGKVKLAPMLEMITSEQLMTHLGECILDNMPQNLSQTSQANYEQNMQDAMSVMHKLQTGLDVNVKFTGVADFEYTPELIIFDLLEISLYHGWLVDPQDSETVKIVNQDSYNQLVEKIIFLKHADNQEDVTQALIAEQFLDRTASQLTYHGLCELASVVKENEPCVFFRNNHFSTLYKHNNEMFLLVTDQGFLTESNVVWETLSTVDGDCHFTDATFRTFTKQAASIEVIPDPAVPVGSPEQIDHDYQVALYLQEEASADLNPAWGGGYTQDMSTLAQYDHDLALRLQEEEDKRERAEQQRIAQAAGGGGSQPVGFVRGPPSDSQQRRGGDREERRAEKEKNVSCICHIL